MKYTLPLILFIAFCFQACGNKQSSEASDEGSSAADSLELSPDFLTFYARFHEDSSFQIDHITFPLMGKTRSDSTGTGDDFRWQKENWKIHRPFTDPSGNFQRVYAQPSDKIVIERINLKVGGFTIERRFAKLNDGEWNLIYYAVIDQDSAQ